MKLNYYFSHYSHLCPEDKIVAAQCRLFTALLGPGWGAATLETEDSSYESRDEDIFFTPNTSFSEEDLD